MENEENHSLVDQYRSAVEDVPASDFDQTILAAAGRQAAVRRLVRRARNAFLVTALAATAMSLAWRSQQLNVAQTRFADYGKSEGTTRSYLLDVTTPPYAGAGINEGAP
jgi:hypothetical protein